VKQWLLHHVGSCNAVQPACNILALLVSPERISVALPSQTAETKLVPIEVTKSKKARHAEWTAERPRVGTVKVICLLVRQDVCSFGKIKYTLSGRKGWPGARKGGLGCCGGC